MYHSFLQILSITIVFDIYIISEMLLKILIKIKVSQFKGLVHSKMKFLLFTLLFTHPQAILGIYDFLLSDESNRSYIKNCSGSSNLYQLERVLLLHSEPILYSQ